MKKLAVFLACLCMILSGCSKEEKWQPELASDDIAVYGNRAVEFIDKYLQFEITEDELQDELLQIMKRMPDPREMSGESGIYTQSDKNISDRMFWLPHYGETISDNIYSIHRDIIAYQVGKPVLKNRYDPISFIDREFSSQEDSLTDALAIYSMPVGQTRLNDDDPNSISLSVNFDYMFGTPVSDVYEYIDTICENAEKNNIPLSKITLEYHCYDQLVFSVELSVSNSEIDGSVALGHNGETVIEVHSFDELKTAIETASEYFGKS